MIRIVCLILLVSVTNVYAVGSKFFKRAFPNNYKSHSAISIGIGGSGYIGDLTPFYVYQSVGFKQLNLSGTLEYQRYLRKNISIKASLSLLRVSADENDYDSCSSFRINYIRNLHFRNDISELGALIQYDFIDRSLKQNKYVKVFPYLAFGINLIHHNPKALAPKKTLSDLNNWIPLNDLSTPTEGVIYKKTALSFPFELGVLYKYNSNIDIGVSLKYRYAFTDYLDDVSDSRGFIIKNPIYSVRSNESIAAANNILRPNNLTGDGEPFNMGGNDVYYTLQFKIVYHFDRSIKCID